MKTEKMDINAVCFGILCNFTPVCGEERAKEAVALIRSLQAELEQARQDCAVAEKNHMQCENQLRQAKQSLAALRPITREQVEKVWSGCDLCLDDSWNRRLVIQKRFDHTTLSYGELALFCPGCGKPLTDEAVQMVIERLEALKE